MNTHTPQSALSSLPQAFRPARELLAAFVWLSFALCLFLSKEHPLFQKDALIALALLFAFVRSIQGLLCLNRKARLAGYAQELVTLKGLRAHLRHATKRNAVFFGVGFEWTPLCSQSAYELQKSDVASLIPARAICASLTMHRPLAREAIGAGWIHGICAKEVPIEVPLKTLEGGTLILGTTQSGKGVLLTLLVSQAIARGEAVIVIDPKGSSRLLSAMDRACYAAKRPAAKRFHPGSHIGVRLDPLANFSRVTELANRVSAGLNETGPFAAFAWRSVYVAANLLIACGKAPNLKAIERIVADGPEETLQCYARAHFGADAFDALYRETRQNTAKTLRSLASESAEVLPTGVLDALSLLEGNPEHQAKLTASLLPLLTSLTSGELETSLASGTPSDDTRACVRLDEMIDTGGILYVATDALPDAFSAASIATLLLADLASAAAQRYNTRSKASPVNLFIDEASNVMSTSLIELLNKGAEAGIHTTCAMQTVSDLEARLGSAAAARMALGNFNTLIALRTKDLETARFATETFGKTAVGTLEASRTSSTDAHLSTTFGANFTRRLAVSRVERVAPELLGALPNTEFFASIAGGRIVKGRVPILVGE